MTREIGIHLSHWQTAWDQPLLPLIGKAAEAGFEVAEFPLLYPRELPYRALKAELDQRGMRASCGTGLGPETDITHPERSVRERGLGHLRACLEGAAALGSPVLGGLTYAPWGVFPEDDPAARRDRCADSLREAAEIAGDLGVQLCLEVVNRFEGYLLNTVRQGLDLLRRVDSPYLSLHLDTFHLNIEADTIAESIREAGPHLGHFHCVANNRKRPGAGHIPWPAVRGALDEIGYRGYLVAETFVSPAGEVGRGMFIWRDLADDLDTNACLTAKFLKRELVS